METISKIQKMQKYGHLNKIDANCKSLCKMRRKYRTTKLEIKDWMSNVENVKESVENCETKQKMQT